MEPEKEFNFNFPWYKKILFVLSPTFWYRRFIVGQKFYDTEYDRIINLFNEKRIDLIPKPINSNRSRGFKIIIDKKRAIGFVQDGDYFVLEGYEQGDQGVGDVTIFDDLKKEWD